MSGSIMNPFILSDPSPKSYMYTAKIDSMTFFFSFSLFFFSGFLSNHIFLPETNGSKKVGNILSKLKTTVPRRHCEFLQIGFKKKKFLSIQIGEYSHKNINISKSFNTEIKHKNKTLENEFQICILLEGNQPKKRNITNVLTYNRMRASKFRFLTISWI